MKRLLIFTLFLLIGCQSATPQQVTGKLLQARFTAPDRLQYGIPSADGMDYLFYLPENYYEEPNREWPLILYLHGAGDLDNDSAFLMTHGLPMVLNLDEQPDNFEFVVIAPQAFPNKRWWDGDALHFAVTIISEVMATYNIDKERIYVTGVSMGGYGTWWMATEFPDRFAAAVSVSGSGYQTPEIPGSRRMCRMRPVAIWAVHGDSDKISNPDAMQLYFDAYPETCGDNFRYTMYEGEGHLSTPGIIYRDPALYDWLLEHKLDR